MDNMTSLEKRLQALEEVRTGLFAAQKPIHDALVVNCNKIAKLKDKIAKLKIAKMKKPIWEILLEEDTGMEMYKKCQKELATRGLCSSGYFPSTGQRCIKVMLMRGDKGSYVKTIKALKEISPHIKPLSDGEHVGYKFVGILESTLSEHGIFYMLFKDNEYRLMRNRYHRTEELKKFKTVEKIVEYVQINHFYEDKRKE